MDIKAERRKNGDVNVYYEFHRYRFLLSDGTVVEVNAIADGSDLRAALLTLYPKDVRIEGCAGPLPMQEPML